MTIKYPCNRCPVCGWDKCSSKNPYDSKVGYDCIYFATYVEQGRRRETLVIQKKTKRINKND